MMSACGIVDSSALGKSVDTVRLQGSNRNSIPVQDSEVLCGDGPVIQPSAI